MELLKSDFLPQNANLLENQKFSLFIQCLNSWQTIPRNNACTGNYRQQDTATNTGSALKGGIYTLKFPIDSEKFMRFCQNEHFTVIRIQISFNMSIGHFFIFG